MEDNCVLKMNNLYFEKLLCVRNPKFAISDDLAVELGVDINKEDGNEYKVSLKMALEDKNNSDSLKVEIVLCGVFGLNLSENKDEIDCDSMIKKNTVAIMFPYMRAQLTLLTSQPNMNSIVLKPINIAALLEE